MSKRPENDLLLRALEGGQMERYPVWVMRQAGRILPEYRELRASMGSFKEFVQTPEAAAEATMQPVRRFGMDAAILFSDILVIPEAMGLDYEMIKGKGPFFPKTVRTASELAALPSNPDIEDRLSYVIQAIEITLQKLEGRTPLIGFAGAPWTIFCYMVEGEGSKTFSKARKLAYQEPELAHEILQRITDATITYLKAKIKAGVHAVQLFDSWAGIPAPDQYSEFGLKYARQVAEAINEVPFIFFPKGAATHPDMGPDWPIQGIGVDWLTSLEDVRTTMGNDICVQGNMDPCALYQTEEAVVKQTLKMLESFAGRRHIANLGHGVYPDVDPERVRAFVDTIKGFPLH